jgi:hypothetical protein
MKLPLSIEYDEESGFSYRALIYRKIYIHINCKLEMKRQLDLKKKLLTLEKVEKNGSITNNHFKFYI